jgi:hypothetical protein
MQTLVYQIAWKPSAGGAVPSACADCACRSRARRSGRLAYIYLGFTKGWMHKAVAIYYHQLQSISRGAGRSTVAAAAYRAGEELYDRRTDKLFDYERRGDEAEAQRLLHPVDDSSRACRVRATPGSPECRCRARADGLRSVAERMQGEPLAQPRGCRSLLEEPRELARGQWLMITATEKQPALLRRDAGVLLGGPRFPPPPAASRACPCGPSTARCG